MTRILLVVCCLAASLWSAAQTAVIEGTIRDLDGLPAAGVIVQQKDNPGNGVAANDVGEFRLQLPAERAVVVIFKGIGASSLEREFRLKAGEVRKVDLLYDNTAAAGVITIRAEREGGMKPIETKLPTKLPTINPGIESYLLQMPVNFASELSSSYSVRGGSFDENLVYVNGIQVYRPFLVRAGEQEGLSFPNPDMVSNIRFSAGGFAARYGDKMSSVLDIQYARPDSAYGSFTLGLLGGSVHTAGISKNRTFTHNTGIRYKDNSYVFNSLDVQGDYKPRYYDVQTYLTWRPEQYSPFELSFLGNYQNNRYQFVPSTRSTDVGTINEALRLTVYFDGKEETRFETMFGAFSAKYNPSPQAQMSITASAFNTYETEYFDIQGAYSLDELERDLGSDQFGEVLRNRGVGGFLDHARNALSATVLNVNHRGFVEHEAKKNVFSWGFDAQQEYVYDKLREWSLVDSAGYASPRPPDSLGYTNPAVQPDQQIYLHDRIRAVNDINSRRLSAYVQDEKRWVMDDGSIWTINAGARANYWTFNNQLVGGPRVAMSYTPVWMQKRTMADGSIDSLRKDIILTAAFGYYWQPAFYREMRDFGGAVNPEIRAQRSIHYIVGANYVFQAWNRPFKINSEIYYKQLRDLIPYEVENVRLRYFATNNSNGYAYGMDVMLNGEFIKDVQSWARLSWMKTEEDLVDDEYYLYLNASGDTIYNGFTLDNVAVDSIRQVPGFIPRPNDQRVSFSLLFQDEMKKKPWYKVLMSFYFSTGVPYGPPSQERYLDISRTRSYIRADIGFSRDLILEKNKDKNWFNRTFDRGYVALEIFNLLGTNNIINHQWIEDVNGRQYGIPTYLTGRRLNLRMSLSF
ncbi:MAG: TonB-dependent receptor plug domain-containing protein [Flavobacteriales bacterium]|jgi:hypothetical protein